MGTNILLSLIVGVAMTAIVGSQIGPNYIEQIKIKKVQTKTINNQDIIFEGIKRYVTIKQVQPNSLQDVINAGYLDPNVNDNGFSGNYAIVVDKAKGVATITTTITDTSVHEAFLNSFTNMSKPNCTGVISNKVCSTNTFKTTFVIPNEVMHGNALLMTGVPIQSTPPDSSIYKYWYDTSSGKATLKLFDGTKWIEVNLGGSGDDSTNVKLSGDQTIAGIKSFSSFPITPTLAPTSNYEVANKKYVDDKIASAGFTQSLSQNGWTKLPNGLILQWGKVTYLGYSQTFSFPITFPNNILNLIISPLNETFNGTDVKILTYTKSNFKLSSNFSNEVNKTISYFAIGY